MRAAIVALIMLLAGCVLPELKKELPPDGGVPDGGSGGAAGGDGGTGGDGGSGGTGGTGG